MIIKSAFIPCAGKGTRMGPLGLKLAKPLWPVYDKTLLEVQIEILKKLECSHFMINTHHLHQQIQDEMRNIECKASIFNETDLLGSGGCFHNLIKNENSLGKIVSLNSDIQILMSVKDEARLKKDFQENDFVLVCLPIQKGEHYNEVCFDEEGFFTEVKLPNTSRDYVTYSGFGMVNLSKLKHVSGESSFFDSVINKNINKTKIFVPSEPFEYWDWGTKELYQDNVKRLSNSDNNSLLKRFLTDIGAIDINELKDNSYRANTDGTYNFSGLKMQNKERKGIYVKVGDQSDLLPF